MSIRDTLEQFAEGWKTLGIDRMTHEQFVLEYGKTYHNVAVGKRGAKKECFSNAARLVLASEGEAIYVEGYCMSKKFGLPILHAWIERREDGAAFEVTLDDPENYEYFGIRYQTEFLVTEMVEHRVWGILGGHPQTARELLLGDTTEEEFLL